MNTETCPDRRAQHCDSTPIELEGHDTAESLRWALRCYARMASRPRKSAAWSWMGCQLWNARQDAVRAGILVKHRPDGSLTDAWEFVSARYRDCVERVELARLAEVGGHPGLRI